MNVDTLKQLLDIGWPALITIAFVVLAKWYRDDVNEQITYLRKRIDTLEASFKSQFRHDIDE